MKFILLLSVFYVFSLPGHAIHFFNGTYEEALHKAKNENKNLFISFTASWCGPCRMMKELVFTNEKVTQYTDEHYICMLTDIEFRENMELNQRINAEVAGFIPYVCIITPDEKVMKEGGSMTVHQILKFLKLRPTDQPIRNMLSPAEQPPFPEKPHLFQHRTPYETVVEQARRENKNMLLCFSSHFCGPCQQMVHTTFQNPTIMQKVNREYITGYFETGDPKDRALCYRYHNTNSAIPYLILVSPDEKIIKKNIGYMDSTAFMNFLQPTSESLNENISPQEITLPNNKIPWINKFLYNQTHHKWKLHFTAAINTTTLKTSGSLSKVNFNYRVGYELGFSFAYERKHWAITPGLIFTSKGGKNKEITLRQNYLELPVKFHWIYQNHQNGWWKGISMSPYGAIRIGEKIKNDNTALAKELFKTKRFDYGLRFATNLRYNSFDLEAGYLLGLQNLSDYQRGKLYNRGFFLNMSLCF